MKYLIEFKEFGVPGAPTIKSIFQSEPFTGKEQVVAYMKNSKRTMPQATAGIDAFTGERVLPSRHLMTDGEYSWDNMLIYYIEKYNAKPPQDFIDKVLGEKI